LKKYLKVTFILLSLAVKTYSQSYNITLKYSANGAGCHAASYNWSFYGGGVLLDDFGAGGNSMNIPLKTVTYNTSAYSSFSLSISSGCTPLGASTKDCNDEFTYSATAINLIKGTAGLSAGSCNGSVYISSFIPDVNIKNLDTSTPTEVCAGFQLSLAAFPAGFPQEAYHWQYSINNKVSWIDVPATISGRQTNNIATPTFSMQELLGATHTNHLNKQIFFRLGYSGTAFTTPLALTYSSCAPVAEYIKYEAPQCNGNNVEKIEVFFKEKLKTGEDLSIIYVVNTDPAKTTPRFQNTALITSFTLDPATNLYKYSFPNLGETLENGNFYTVKYQARLNGQPMGSLQVSQQPFKYIDPAKMQFKITGQTQPTCFGAEDGTIDIEILSGESPYNFYVDNVLKTASKIDDLHYKITGLKANVLGYKIKVTDKNDCIEKL